MNHDYSVLSAGALAKLVASRSLTAVELMETVVNRAAAAHERLNCFAVPLFDEAMERAREADLVQTAGRTLGPLHGVPVTIKDGVATAGHRLTFGSASRADVIAADDDIVWQRLKTAGAILIGKTTTPEFFHKVVTDSPLFGVTRNPWSLEHSPGGSSGGAAATIAAGVVPIALGSDGGGSLRCPASCTGTLALKPTRGRIPQPSIPETFGNYAAVGPITRNVADLALMLSVMSGGAADDACSIGVPPLVLPDETFSADGGGLRIGWIADPGSYGADASVVQSAHAALEKLTDAGCRVEPIDGSFLDDVFQAYTVIGSVAHASRSRIHTSAEQALWSDSFKALVEQGISYSASDLQKAQEDRTRLFRAVQAVFRNVDVIATPTLTAPPKPVDAEGSTASAEYAAWAAALYPFNLTGHPAMSVPCGMTGGGLPLGVQIVAPWYEETRLIRVAAMLERLNPWADRRPPQ